MDMTNRTLTERFAACSLCQSTLRLSDDGKELSCLNCGTTFPILDDIPAMMTDCETGNDLSRSKWDTAYQAWTGLEEEFRNVHMDGLLTQLLTCVPDNRPGEKRVYLEIGCGMGFVGEALMRAGWTFVGVDYSLAALRQLKDRLRSRNLNDYLLIHGDIEQLPIVGGAVQLVGGYGVIEHLRDPVPALRHVHRVLEAGGVSFNTVPYLNLANVLYRSTMWGSIPNVPLLKQVLEFVNIRLLKGKRMTFGYELQLSGRQLRHMHAAAGFRPENVRVERFDCEVKLQYVPSQRLRNFFAALCKRHRQFWPMVKVIAAR